MEWLAAYDLILLDLDGLLVDTEHLHFAAYQQLAKQHGYEVPFDFQEYLQLAHSSSEGLKKTIYPNLSQDKEWGELYEEKKQIYLELLKGVQVELMSGVEEFLTALLRMEKRCCVVTNSPKKQVDAICRRQFILNRIPNWVTREDYARAKPAPDGYLKAIELYSKPGDRIVGLEDSLKGLEALKAAGAKAVLICAPGRFSTESFPSILQVRI